MKALLRALTWWNSQTLNTQLFTWRKGVRVGEDGGNIYYRTRDDRRRWVIYNGETEASRVNPDWHGWLHHTWDVPPNEKPLTHKSWEKPLRKIVPVARLHMHPRDLYANLYHKTGRITKPSLNRIEWHGRKQDRSLCRRRCRLCSYRILHLRFPNSRAVHGAGNYSIYASFRSAEGVRVGTDVRLAGVKIGSVTQIELDGATYEAKSTLSIEKNIQIPEDSSLAIASEGLLGGNFVEVMPGVSDDFLQSGDEVVDTQGSVSLIQLMMRCLWWQGLMIARVYFLVCLLLFADVTIAQNTSASR